MCQVNDDASTLSVLSPSIASQEMNDAQLAVRMQAVLNQLIFHVCYSTIHSVSNAMFSLYFAAQFTDAVEAETKKAKSSGDVCCICLSKMKLGKTKKKKLSCNHMLHTMCLCEMLERVQRFDAALCPQCRVSEQKYYDYVLQS